MPMTPYKTPGVYREDVFQAPEFRLLTGVPAFLGYAVSGPVNTWKRLTVWSQYIEIFSDSLTNGYLASAVRGFFENGGTVCYVVRLDSRLPEAAALEQGLAALEPEEELDLVCAPDIM